MRTVVLHRSFNRDSRSEKLDPAGQHTPNIQFFASMEANGYGSDDQISRLDIAKTVDLQPQI